MGQNPGSGSKFNVIGSTTLFGRKERCPNGRHDAQAIERMDESGGTPTRGRRSLAVTTGSVPELERNDGNIAHLNSKIL